MKKPEELVFIEDIAEYVQAAEELGLSGIYYQRQNYQWIKYTFKEQGIVV